MKPEDFALKQWEELEKWLRAVYIAGYKAGAEAANEKIILAEKPE